MESPFRDAGGAQPRPDLIETLLRDGGRYPRRALHMARLARSCAALGYPFDADAIAAALDALPPGPLRVRLTVAPSGAVATVCAPFAPTPRGTVWRLRAAEARLDPADPWLRHKSTRRAIHDAARAALPADADEALLLNARGELCEGAITNVFADFGDGLVTPPLSCGLLPGVLRAELLASGRAREGVLRPADLDGARLFVGNALRGLIAATLETP